MAESMFLLPVFLFILFGIADFSLVLREQRVVHSSLNNSTRLSAIAVSKGVVQADAHAEFELSSDDSCEDYLASYSTEEPPTNLLALVKYETCGRIQRDGLNLSDWKINPAQSTETKSIDGSDFNLIKFTVTAERTGKACLFCFGILNDYTQRIQSSQVIREEL